MCLSVSGWFVAISNGVGHFKSRSCILHGRKYCQKRSRIWYFCFQMIHMVIWNRFQICQPMLMKTSLGFLSVYSDAAHSSCNSGGYYLALSSRKIQPRWHLNVCHCADLNTCTTHWQRSAPYQNVNSRYFEWMNQPRDDCMSIWSGMLPLAKRAERGWQPAGPPVSHQSADRVELHMWHQLGHDPWHWARL